jgi:hypothetical protein
MFVRSGVLHIEEITDSEERHVEMVKLAVSLVVNGVLLFALQQWMQHRFRNLDTRISRETTYLTKSGELLVESYKAIWTTLCELEAYLLADFPKHLHEESQTLAEVERRIRYDYGKVRSQLPFLPDDLCQRTEFVIKQLEAHYNTLINALNEAKQSIDPEGALPLINTALSALYSGFRCELDDLMNDYRQAIREALLGS